MPELAKSDVLGAIVLLVVALVLWFGPDVLRVVVGLWGQRQSRRDQMFLKLPVTVRRMGKVEGSNPYFADLTLGFGLPKGEMEEFVPVTLVFDWDGDRARYFLSEGQFGVLLEAVWRHGVGKKWVGVQISGLRVLVERSISQAILQRERSMSQPATLMSDSKE